MKKLVMKFSDKWIYGGDGSNSIKLKKVYSELTKALEGIATVTVESIGKCIIEPKDNINGKNFIDTILSITDKYITDISKDDYEITTEDGPCKDTEAEDNDGSHSLLDTINKLIGLDDFKAFCNEIADSADTIRQNKNLFFGEALLCVSDDGNGFDDNIGLLVQLLFEKDIIKDSNVENLNWGSFFDKPEEFPNVQIRSGKPMVYIFDIGGWIGYTNDGRFKDALKFIFRCNKDNLIIFRMGNRSKSVIEDTIRDIEDIINVRVIEFPDFTYEQLYEYAKAEFKKTGFETDENAAEVFKSIVDFEKEDGLFYGINTVKKIAGEMARVSIRAGAENIINSEACKLIVPEKADSQDSLKLIEDMIGMESVAAQMKEIIAQIMFSRASGAKSPAMHMFFTGNPGTGKTTVARALGQIFRENRILRAGKFFEHKGRDLCGEYIGQTAMKVNRICQSAYGSILFIDEAYSLATERSERDYGKEAIDTLIAEMENHSDDLVVIFAGYPDEMEKLLDTNPGMRSRIPYKINFPDYSKEQLHHIFMKMAEKSGYTVTDGFSGHVKQFFMRLPDELINSRQFGNARFVRNIFERTWGKAILRCPAGTYDVPPLSPADFDAATAEFKISAPEKNKIGF